MKNSVKKYRQWAEYTQASLAEAMQVSRQTVNAIEKGKYVPSTMLALKMSNLLKTPVDSLFELEEGDWQKGD